MHAGQAVHRTGGSRTLALASATTDEKARPASMPCNPVIDKACACMQA